ARTCARCALAESGCGRSERPERGRSELPPDECPGGHAGADDARLSPRTAQRAENALRENCPAWDGGKCRERKRDSCDRVALEPRDYAPDQGEEGTQQNHPAAEQRHEAPGNTRVFARDRPR